MVIPLDFPFCLLVRSFVVSMMWAIPVPGPQLSGSAAQTHTDL